MEEYKIVLESQLGPREGRFQFVEQEGRITGTLTLLGFQNPISGERTETGSLRLFHYLRTAVSELVCASELELAGKQLTGTLRSGQNVMRWHGEKISNENAGDDGDE